MRCPIQVMSLLFLLALGLDSAASPEAGGTKRESALSPFSSFAEIQTFRGRERSMIAVYGKTAGVLLGVYVFDPHGNCIALDDGGDDLAVEWYSSRMQPYGYEVRNLGVNATALEIAIR